MAIQVDDIRFYFSGGVGNTTGAGSLGGIKSSTRVASQTATPIGGLVTGVSIISANNNSQGNGEMTYNPSNQYLSWQPPGSSYVYTVLVTGTGTYSIGGSDGTLTVAVTFGSLPTVYKIDTVAISLAIGAVFPSISAAQSLLGYTNYRCLYIGNAHATLTCSALSLYIAQVTTGPDSIYVGLDPAGVGDGSTTGVATTIVDELTAPAGVTFTEPLSAGSGLAIASVAPGQCFAFWQKRVVTPESLGYIAINTSKIGVALTA